MSNKGYIVLETGWEYDDQYYYQYENGGGHPLSIHTTKESAQKEADRKTIEYVRGSKYPPNVRDYVGEDLYSVNLTDIALKVFGFKEADHMIDDWDWTIQENATDNEVIEALRDLGIRFYEVVEVVSHE